VLLCLTPLKWARGLRTLREIRSVALVKTAAIGDTVLLSALVSDLKAWKPDLRIVLFAGESNAFYGRLLTGVDRVVELKLTKIWHCIRLLRSESFDVTIDVDSWPRISAVFAVLSSTDCVVGFKTFGQYRHFAENIQVTHQDDQHEIENDRALLRALDIPVGAPPQDLGRPWVVTSAKKTITFHLWPGGTLSHLREWPESNWQKLASELIRDGFVIQMSGAPSEREKNAAFIRSLSPSDQGSVQNLAGQSFEMTLESLRTSRLLVSVNTGIMHVGAAMGVPTLGLHGPTNPLRWGPLGARSRSLLSRTPGSAQLNLGFEYVDRIERMAGLDVGDVTSAAQALLRETAPSNRN
jgi:ADP-heptose:LPS heptosyltransferase